MTTQHRLYPGWISSVFLFLYFVLSTEVTHAQIKPIRPFGKIHALIVGISEYQHEKIPDLSYAHRDAEVFARFLQSETRWQLDQEDIVLLTDSLATYAKFLNELQAIAERCAPKDRLILYFSGHGDVEVVSDEKMGYLLFHDASSTTYASGGACMVNTLDQQLQKLVLEKDVEIILISDACRAGSLAGSKVRGTNATASAMAALFENTIKILSCEPQEYSREGPQWGGGRGVFSYYLVKGLQGQADKDRNLYVDLFELRRYVQDSVRHASNEQQNPFSSGGGSSVKVVRVDPEVASRIARPVRPATQPTPTPTAPDTSYLPALARFEAAISRKHLMFPDSGSAYQIYQSIPENPIKKVMKISLATALQDEAQQALNEYIISPGNELARRWADREVYSNYPEYLKKAAELLSEAKFFQNDIRSREHYFRGVNLRLKADSEEASGELLHVALQEQQTALQLQPIAPHIYNEMGLIYRRLKNNLQELANFQKAVALSPTWGLALTNLAYSYKRMGQLGEAEKLYKEAIKADEQLALPHYNLGILYEQMGNLVQAEQEYQTTIQLDPTGIVEAYYNLASILISTPGQGARSEEIIREYLKLAPSDVDGYLLLAYICRINNRMPEAKEALEKSLVLDPDSPYANRLLLKTLADLEEYEKGLMLATKLVTTLPEDREINYLLLEAYAMNQNFQKVGEQLEKLKEMGFDNYQELTTSDLLEDFRKKPAYQQLLGKFFPDRN